MKSLYSMFLSQAYQDCWDDYNRSVKLKNFPRWDYVILTASNDQQAEGFRRQIEERKEYLPAGTRFAAKDILIIGRNKLLYIVIHFFYQGLSLLSQLLMDVIQCGAIQHHTCLFLFQFFNLQLKRITLFDEFMICMSSMPSRIREGMVLLSGDVLLLFNPLQIDYNNVGATAISFKERVEVGKNHGVYVNGEDGNVKCCLQKKSEEKLRKAGAVNEAGCVDIDTGALIFSTAMMDSLYSLIGTEEGYDRYVNGTVRLSLYADFLYPLAENSTLEQFYLEKPEGEFCEELTEARKQVWKVLRPYRMKLLRLAPAKFIHFGTTKEILALMCGGVEEYASLGWSSRVASSISGSTAGYISVLSSRASIGKDCYLEVSYVHSHAKVGNNCVLSFVDIHDEVIPDGVVLHGLKQRDGKFVVRIFGVQDNPKENRLFGRDLDELEDAFGVRLWEENGQAHTLWSAALYQEAGHREGSGSGGIEPVCACDRGRQAGGLERESAQVAVFRL